MSGYSDDELEEEDENIDAEGAFQESLRKFAEAFLALTEEERAELTAYAQGRRQQAEEEYNNLHGKKLQGKKQDEQN